MLTLAIIGSLPCIILVCLLYLSLVFQVKHYLTWSGGKQWLMRCVHFRVVVLGSWSLFCLGNPLLGVGGCILRYHWSIQGTFGGKKLHSGVWTGLHRYFLSSSQNGLCSSSLVYGCRLPLASLLAWRKECFPAWLSWGRGLYGATIRFCCSGRIIEHGVSALQVLLRT